MNQSERKYDIFISHSTKDEKTIEDLCHYLEERNLHCFVAYRDVPKGKDWGEFIVNAIEDCKVFVYVHTQASNKSKETTRELNLAFEAECLVIPFRIENIEYIKAKKYRLTNINWLDAFPGNPEDYFGELFEKIKPYFHDRIQEGDEIEPQCRKTELKRNELEEQQREGREEDQIVTLKGVEFKMLRVQGGTFQMGATSEQGSDAADNEYPVHSVTLSDYHIGQTQVTQELWKAVMGNNPSFFKGDNQRPVENVSWNDCQKFIDKLNRLTGKNFRLPTEAEWEYAARGGNKSKGYKYSGSNDVNTVAWYDDNSGGKTHAVATKQANELGLYDMSGNVWECCQDWYGDYTSHSQSNPKGANTGSSRVLRGGNWISSAGFVRVSRRSGYTPDIRLYDYGLRLAL